MQQIIFATGNGDKMREIHQIMEGLPYEIRSMREAGLDLDIEETGDSFRENSLIKARAVAKEAPGQIVLADDSGLEIDYLDKAPGIYSSRYGGVDTPYPEKNRKFLELLKGVPDERRTARFVCAVSAVFPDGSEEVVQETMEGRIAREIAGENGFGYDPIFFLPEYGVTSAQLLPEQKNEISHRGKALRGMRNILERRAGRTA